MDPKSTEFHNNPNNQEDNQQEKQTDISNTQILANMADKFDPDTAKENVAKANAEKRYDTAEETEDMEDRFWDIENYYGSVENALNAGEDPTKLAKGLPAYLVGENLKTFLKAGAKIDLKQLADEIIDESSSETDYEYIFDNIDEFLSGGVDPNKIVDWCQEYSLDDSRVYELVGKCLSAETADANTIANGLFKNGREDIVARNLKAFLDAGAKIDVLGLIQKLDEEGDDDFIDHNMDVFLAAGADPSQLLNIASDYAVAHNVDQFLAAGIQPAQLIDRMDYIDIADNVDKFLAAGIKPFQLIGEMNNVGIADNVDKFLAAGIDPIVFAQRLFENGDTWTVSNNCEKFLNSGADPEQLAQILLANNEWPVVEKNMDKFVAAGADRQKLNMMLAAAGTEAK